MELILLNCTNIKSLGGRGNIYCWSSVWHQTDRSFSHVEAIQLYIVINRVTKVFVSGLSLEYFEILRKLNPWLMLQIISPKWNFSPFWIFHFVCCHSQTLDIPCLLSYGHSSCISSLQKKLMITVVTWRVLCPLIARKYTCKWSILLIVGKSKLVHVHHA